MADVFVSPNRSSSDAGLLVMVILLVLLLLVGLVAYSSGWFVSGVGPSTVTPSTNNSTITPPTTPAVTPTPGTSVNGGVDVKY